MIFVLCLLQHAAFLRIDYYCFFVPTWILLSAFAHRKHALGPQHAITVSYALWGHNASRAFASLARPSATPSHTRTQPLFGMPQRERRCVTGRGCMTLFCIVTSTTSTLLSTDATFRTDQFNFTFRIRIVTHDAPTTRSSHTHTYMYMYRHQPTCHVAQ